jgi:hypothetical protein
VRINFSSAILCGPGSSRARQNQTVGPRPCGRALLWGCAVALRLGRVGVGVRATYLVSALEYVLITDSTSAHGKRFGILSCMPACVNSHLGRDSGGRLPTITSSSVVQCLELTIRPYKHRNSNIVCVHTNLEQCNGACQSTDASAKFTGKAPPRIQHASSTLSCAFFRLAPGSGKTWNARARDHTKYQTFPFLATTRGSASIAPQA